MEVGDKWPESCCTAINFFCDVSQCFFFTCPSGYFCDLPQRLFLHCVIILHSSHSLTCIPPNHIREIQKEKTKVLFWVQLPHHLTYKLSLSTIGLSRFRNVCELTTRHLVAETLISMMKSVSFRAPSSFASLTLLEKVELWNWKRAKPFPIFLLCNEVETNIRRKKKDTFRMAMPLIIVFVFHTQKKCGAVP